MIRFDRRLLTAVLIAAPVILTGALAVGPSLRAQDDGADARRLADQLALEPGRVVAEIGAGDGELTVAIARLVGPGGRVYSNEISESRRKNIERAVDRAGLQNVTLVDGRAAETNLPDGCCDAIFMRNVYHHFADPAAMGASLFRALKAGGRLAIIDFAPGGGREAEAAADRDESPTHGVMAATVERELRHAGFELVATEPAARGDRWYMVVARRP